MRSAAWIYGVAAIGLGAVALAFHDVPLQWQRVPLTLPGRSGLALLWGMGLLLAGAMACVQQWRLWSCLALACSYAVYALWFLVPATRAGALSAGGWLAFCEVFAMACGGAIIWGAMRSDRVVWALAARVLVGLCALNFALCHFVYIDITAGMVPRWLGGPRFWALLTGLGHGLAGLALITGVHSKLAAGLEAAMCATFVMLVHVPAVAATPTDHRQWATLAIAFAIAAAAWTVRLAPERARARHQTVAY